MALPCALRTFDPWDQPFVPARETGSLLVSREDSGQGCREVHSNLCSHVFLSRVPVICSKPERTGFSQVQNHQVPALPLVPPPPPPPPE